MKLKLLVGVLLLVGQVAAAEDRVLVSCKVDGLHVGVSVVASDAMGWRGFLGNLNDNYGFGTVVCQKTDVNNELVCA